MVGSGTSGMSRHIDTMAIADALSFIFLWVGDGVRLEQGRQCLKKIKNEIAQKINLFSYVQSKFDQSNFFFSFSLSRSEIQHQIKPQPKMNQIVSRPKAALNPHWQVGYFPKACYQDLDQPLRLCNIDVFAALMFWMRLMFAIISILQFTSWFTRDGRCTTEDGERLKIMPPMRMGITVSLLVRKRWKISS